MARGFSKPGKYRKAGRWNLSRAVKARRRLRPRTRSSWRYQQEREYHLSRHRHMVGKELLARLDSLPMGLQNKVLNYLPAGHRAVVSHGLARHRRLHSANP